MAGPTRLELATSGVTGRRSNQLNYGPAFHKTNENYRSAEMLSTIGLWFASPQADAGDPRFLLLS